MANELKRKPGTIFKKKSDYNADRRQNILMPALANIWLYQEEAFG